MVVRAALAMRSIDFVGIDRYHNRARPSTLALCARVAALMSCRGPLWFAVGANQVVSTRGQEEDNRTQSDEEGPWPG